MGNRPSLPHSINELENIMENAFAQDIEKLANKYHIELEALTENHERAIENAIHFREFAKKVETNTVEHSKRMELYNYWERRADNAERRIGNHINNMPEALRASESMQGGSGIDHAEKTHQRPGNHLPGPRPKHKPDGQALRTT